MKDLVKKNCFITGAASGIGRSFAIALANEGMNLFISDINMEDLKRVKEEIDKVGVKVYTGRCDVAKFSDWEKISKDFFSELKELDLLINNAGIGIGGDIFELELEDWKRVLDINLWSIIHSLKVFLPHMYNKHSGHIVNIASGAGVFGSAEPIPYITSKFAVVGLSEALFGQLYNQNIRVSVIIPSYIKTNIFSKAKIKYSKKLIDAYGEDKIEKIYRSFLDETTKNAMSPDKAVKRYIRGIKKDQLYVYDMRSVLGPLFLKSNPQLYEKFLIDYNKNALKTTKEYFLKFGINIDEYK
ncbi:MAG: SDR family NAD(P)-dependent oxidoreductase [Promethearchaeota archaeon]